VPLVTITDAARNYQMRSMTLKMHQIRLPPFTPQSAWAWTVAASWVKKVGGAGNLQFSHRQLQISDRDIMGAQNFNFVPTFSQNGVLTPNFAFLDEFFPTIFRQPKI